MDPNQNTDNQTPQENTDQPKEDKIIAVNKGSGLKIPNFGKFIKIFGIVFVLIGVVALIGFLSTRFLSIGQPETTYLTYWGAWQENEVMLGVIADFEEKNPNIRVNYEKQDVQGLGQYVQRLKTRINNETGPDIYSFHSSWTFQLQNYLSPLTPDIAERIGLEKDYYSTVKRDLVLNSTYYGVPLFIDTLALFTNNQKFESVDLNPPNEWIDLERVYVPELVEKDGERIISSSIALGTYENVENAPDIMAMMFLQNGANLSDLAGEDRISAETALQFYKSFATGSDRVWDITLDNSKEAFAKGNLAMYFGYARDIKDILSINPNLQFRVNEAPRLISVKSPVASYWAEGVSSKTKNQDAAYKFLEFLSQPENLEKLANDNERVTSEKLIYPRRSMQDKLKDRDRLLPIAIQADDARSTFFSSDTYDGEDGMITVVNNSLENAIEGNDDYRSVSKAIDLLTENINNAVRKYGQ